MGSPRRGLALLVVATCVLPGAGISAASAASKTVDLDGKPENGAESRCDLNVISSFPVKIENVVTNKAVGEAFDFSWFSAGPGGFISSAARGSTGGVGAKWTWTTNQSVYSYTGNTCAKDVCFLETQGPAPVGGTCIGVCGDDGARLTVARGSSATEVRLTWSGGDPNFKVYRSRSPNAVTDASNLLTETSGRAYTDTAASGQVEFYVVSGTSCLSYRSCRADADCGSAGKGSCVSRGPFLVPGRSLTSTDITVSSASLTSSLITFFSPPTEVFRVTSTAQPGGVLETQVNSSTTPVTVVTEAYPPGCCPADPLAPHQLNCDGTCVNFLSDPLNCGACGNACGDGQCCTNGNCVSLCAEGQVWCNGACVDPQNDGAHCGACGNACGEGACCLEGDCVSLCAAGEAYCDGQCADVQSDVANCGACGNACGDGACCTAGVCSPLLCEAGRTVCGDLCFDLQNDPQNCGACGAACAADSVCAGGACVPCTDPHKRVCDNRCVDIRFDPYNCGSCGEVCQGYCPSGYMGVCAYDDRSDFWGGCHCEPGTPDPPPPPNTPQPTQATCPDNTPPTNPEPGSCPNTHPTDPVPGECPSPGPPAPPVPEAPICTVAPSTETIPPGAALTVCRPGGVLFREVPSSVSVCGDGIPGPDGTCGDGVSNVSTGTFMRFTPDTETEVGDAFVTPYGVHVISDASRDGLIQPGETVSLLVDVVNAGPLPIVDATATLVAEPVDLTDDGVHNPVTMTVVSGTSPYGTIPGTQPSSNCEPVTLVPATNQVAFTLAAPFDHPNDTASPLKLRFTGTVNGSPFSMDMPFALGVADWCSILDGAGDFDTIDGLQFPMARLVPKGDQVPFPGARFPAGQVRPLGVRLACDRYVLRFGEVDAPRIVGISEAARGNLDLANLDLNAAPDSADLSFTWNASLEQWTYGLRTADLGRGVFTLTIRLGGRKDYVTGLEIR